MKTMVISILVLLSCKSYAQTCKEVVGYFPNWQWYDRNKLVNPSSIDYSKYSILNYAFFAPQSDGSIDLTDPWADENLLLGQIDWANGGYVPNTSIVDLAHNNGVQILPSIGGWTLSNHFPGIAADPTKRALFVQSCIDLIQTYNFDGIDLDWEYPGFPAHGGTPQDKQNFNLLLQDLRAALDNYETLSGKTMLLTAAVGVAADRMDDVDWPVVEQYLDIINLMSYDFFGTWDPETNHNSPLFNPGVGDPEFNIACSVERLINHYNVSPNKVTVGVPFYGRSVTTPSAPDLHVPSNGTADNATFSIDQGTPLYYSVLDNWHLFDHHWDSLAMVPYLTGKNGLNTFVSYDDANSVALKAQYIVDQDLRGAIIWEITGDYIETSPGSGVIAGTPLADTLNQIFCSYIPYTSGLQNSSCGAGGSTGGGTGGGGTGNGDSTLTVQTHSSIGFHVFPNPSRGTAFLYNQEQSAKIEIIGMDGTRIRSIKVVHGQNTLSLEDLASGVYFIRMTTESGKVYQQKLVRE